MTTSNQISGYTYDPSGNLTVIPGTGGATYTYNGESELTTTTAGVNYTYDGDGQRVEKNNGTLFWYGPGGEVLEETGLTGGFMEDYVFFGGQRVARMDSSKDIFAYFEDHLGTARVMQKIVPGGSTATLVYDADFRPYGRESILTQTGNPLYKFDGKRRDTESNLDDFGARYYSFTIGRFMSADWSAVPAPVPYANLTNPQTLNLYAMVSDNPETYADLDGHEPDGATDAQDSATDGAPPQCPVEGCPVYEIDYADGPLDTSQAQNNAEARNDATVDGTTNQTKTTQTTFTYTDSADQVSVLQQTTTTTTTDAHGNVTTTETSTTLFFSTAPGHEGEFVSGTQRSTMNVRDSQGHTTPFGTDQTKLDAGSARAAVGDAVFARGRSAAIPSAATSFLNRHIDQHALARGIAIGGALSFTPFPEGWELAKEVVEVLDALHTVYDSVH